MNKKEINTLIKNILREWIGIITDCNKAWVNGDLEKTERNVMRKINNNNKELELDLLIHLFELEINKLIKGGGNEKEH